MFNLHFEIGEESPVSCRVINFHQFNGLSVELCKIVI